MPLLIEDRLRSNALYAASAEGHADVVQQLLEHGADVNAQRGHYGNALYAASYAGYTKVVRQLLEHGANVNAQGGHYSNVLYAASYGGQAEIVRLLLEHSVDVNAQGGHYGNALQAASYAGHAEVVQQLLEYGADVNAQGGHFGNALFSASFRGQAEIVRQLLEHGAKHSADVHRLLVESCASSLSAYHGQTNHDDKEAERKEEGGKAGEGTQGPRVAGHSLTFPEDDDDVLGLGSLMGVAGFTAAVRRAVEWLARLELL
ncbi:hypothetical protein VTI74DRAFT_2560 [Chaetomium olivicolor]